MRETVFVIGLCCALLAGCGDSGSSIVNDAGQDGAQPDAGPPPPDWVITVDPADPANPLSTALLGHYDLSGALYAYDQVPGLVQAMSQAGFGEWRVGLGRWETATLMLPETTDGTPCIAPVPEAMAPAGTTDASLMEARDWFTDDGSPVLLSDTADDARYNLDYVRSAIDVADAFGARPYVSIDLMPRALAANKTPLRSDANVPDACTWSFTNQVSNSAPEDNAIFAAAVAGMVSRVVEGSHGQPGRPVEYWEVWNEPDLCYFWDPLYQNATGCFDEPADQRFLPYIEMALPVLSALDNYRQTTGNSDGQNIKIGMGSFANASVAAALITQLDNAPGVPVPLDFISFHSYSNEPLDIVAGIETVSAAVSGSFHYRHLELVLAEWGPELSGPAEAHTMAQPLLMSTVIVMGAYLGVTRTHHSIFWDFYDVMNWGLYDHDVQPRPLARGYALLARIITDGSQQLMPATRSDGRLDGNAGAVLAARDEGGTVRVLILNNSDTARTARIDLADETETPAQLHVFSDPQSDPAVTTPTGPVITVPPRSMVLAEF